MKDVKVVPAILTDDPAAFESMIKQSEGFAPVAQIDIMDGQFVPSLSIPPEVLGRYKPSFASEIHLMTLNPEEYLTYCKQHGARRVIFHFEATPRPEYVISRIKEMGFKVGLAVNPETSVAEFAHLVPQVDMVLFMSVIPGFYGAPFIPEVLLKVKEFKRRFPETEIGLDGGAKQSNIPEIVAAGVNDICVGSAIFRQSDPQSSYLYLDKLAKNSAKEAGL
ncbi:MULTISPECIES: ribulose-phosphate 3-epimerase [Dehalococcoides]|uniref:Ribulose-phosphate 3-epimerase n=2 Tax=Dehalococcoides mccartyi TaxID=61435 RepID=A0A142VAP8_9CHLR|nr:MULTISPECIES: ribulose-phosphate 3-epimerase [Dehalococcoides]AGG06273.1 ribulose-phosphate 3-epimerase [Dehalococcoides mccartyi DCMB5]AGG07705.1 ribulose-phosphate 3-epimerase [Dehalococcoides mccartyi BTF08]AII60738.1 ribulose-phosphate 3-epimerase [Dehalococcoides mccartyi CG5]AMU86407.1 ribulose-phosphate 3-epimerase [Dehalococcoides mccartyi]AOV99235.1 ribulose-phosphate 3-epimerase [Dehalococcoides mccartyi]